MPPPGYLLFELQAKQGLTWAEMQRPSEVKLKFLSNVRDTREVASEQLAEFPEPISPGLTFAGSIELKDFGMDGLILEYDAILSEPFVMADGTLRQTVLFFTHWLQEDYPRLFFSHVKVTTTSDPRTDFPVPYLPILEIGSNDKFEDELMHRVASYSRHALKIPIDEESLEWPVYPRVRMLQFRPEEELVWEDVNGPEDIRVVEGVDPTLEATPDDK